MPSKNTIRFYDAPAYYHIYNRGANKSPIFLDDADKSKFLSLIERYLNPLTLQKDGHGMPYPTYDVAVNAYCLMDNHYHLLLFQPNDSAAIHGFMKSLSTAYSMYFNFKYKHQGTIFQGVFKASRIADESYLQHISRYIHMNPRAYITYPWSSVSYYLGEASPEWLKTDSINDMTPAQYRQFLNEYEGRKEELAILKDELADQ